MASLPSDGEDTDGLVHAGEDVLDREGYVLSTRQWGRWFIAPSRQSMLLGWVAFFAPSRQ